MAKSKSIFACQSCGWEGPKWQGQCPQCQSWNTITEEQALVTEPSKQRFSLSTESGKAFQFSEIETQSLNRKSSGLKEFDSVLGGGFVQGSFVLLGGDPGIGKSTLLLQVCAHLSCEKQKVLYVSAEESASQTALRAQRLKVSESNLLFCSEASLEEILKQAKKIKPKVLVIDSIQTVHLQSLTSAPGTVSQVRECAGMLMSFAKSYGITVIIVGHVTKDGNLAGPRVLEHLVDTVLSFEGDSNYQFRILRSSKNRFGSTRDIAVFEMCDTGLKEVSNPSQFFLRETSEDRIGSSIFTAMEGSRPLLCEIQSLVVETNLAIPRRTSLGLDSNRIHMILAVLDKHLGAKLSSKDVFINLVGGLKISDPASDFPIAISILSSLYKQPISKGSCFFGEIGLTGELRSCRLPRERLLEAEKLGFTDVYLPESLKESLKSEKFKINLHFINQLKQAKSLFEFTRKSYKPDNTLNL